MKLLGIVLIVIGLIWCVIAFNMDTTVTTAASYQRYGSGEYAVGINIPSMTVQNIGLMEERRNYLIFSSLTALAGIVLFGFASIQKQTPAGLKPCPVCAELIQPNAIKCRYCGHDLPENFATTAFTPGISPDSSDSELMDFYSITYNGKYYECGEMHFDRLEQALEHARMQERLNYRT